MEEPPTPTPVAFISHHSSQHATARDLKTRLAENGISAWMAPDDIRPGEPFDDAIVEQVRRSDVILLLFCSQSDQSRHVKRELMLAEDEAKPIFPIRLEALNPVGLAYWLKDYQWIDWLDGRDATIERLVETIKSHTAGTSPQPPMSSPVTGPKRRGRRRWAPWAGGGIAIAGIAVALFLFLGPGETAGDDQLIRPGLWETQWEATDFVEEVGTYDGYLDELHNLSREPRTTCITAAEAVDPPAELFDPGRRDACGLDRLAMRDGRLEAALTCRPDGPTGNITTVQVSGDYTATRMNLRAEHNVEQILEVYGYYSNVTIRHIGPCS